MSSFACFSRRQWNNRVDCLMERLYFFGAEPGRLGSFQVEKLIAIPNRCSGSPLDYLLAFYKAFQDLKYAIGDRTIVHPNVRFLTGYAVAVAAVMQDIGVPHDLAELSCTELPRSRVADYVVGNPLCFLLRNFRRFHGIAPAEVSRRNAANLELGY